MANDVILDLADRVDYAIAFAATLPAELDRYIHRAVGSWRNDFPWPEAPDPDVEATVQAILCDGKPGPDLECSACGRHGVRERCSCGGERTRGGLL